MSFLACAVIYTAWYILHHDDFNNDDLNNFLLARESGFLEFITTPTELHFVPLHRLLSWLVYQAAPMNFSLAVAIIMAFHLGSLVYLYRTLRVIGSGDAGKLIVCAYSASALIVFGLIWWAHAQHRAPYVFLDLCAIYHYLAWLRQKGRRHAVISIAAFLLAFGFYEKAIFIPVHMLIIGCLAQAQAFQARPWKSAVLPAALLCISGIYSLVYLSLQPSGQLDAVAQVQSMRATVGSENSSARPQQILGTLESMDKTELRLKFLLTSIRSEAEFVKVAAGAISGLSMEGARDVATHGVSPRLLIILLLFGGLYAFGTWLVPGSWKILLALPVILLVDFSPLALSTRGTFFWTLITHQYRFYYEELHLIALLAGLWCAALFAAKPALKADMRIWIAGLMLLLGYAALNLSNLRSSADTPGSMLAYMRQSHAYLHNLRDGLSKISESRPSFENTPIPRSLSIYGLILDTKTLLPLFIPDARFDQAGPRYYVAMDGQITRIGTTDITATPCKAPDCPAPGDK